MKNLSLRRKATLIAVTATALVAGTARAISGDVAVSIQTAHGGPYLPGIPILLNVVITNTGTRPTALPEPAFSGRDDPYNALDILTGRDGEELARVACVVPNFGPWKEGLPPVLPSAMALAPGEDYTLTVALSHDWQRKPIASLLEPGVLMVQAALCDYGADESGGAGIDRTRRVLSNVLQITIEKPEGAAATAWERVKESERPWLLAHPAAVEYVTQETDFRRFQEIAGMNAGEYSRHAAALVAYMFAQGNALDLNPGRPPQPQVAKQWLDKAMSGKVAAAVPPDWKRLARKLEKAGTVP